MTFTEKLQKGTVMCKGTDLRSFSINNCEESGYSQSEEQWQQSCLLG